MDLRVSPSLVDGIERARRPTGPVLGLVVAVVCLLVGPLPVTLLLMPVFGVSFAELADADFGIGEQMVVMLGFAGASGLLALWVLVKERRGVGSLGFFPAVRIGRHLALGALVAVLLLAVPIGANLLGGWYEIAPTPGFPLLAVVIALAGFAVQAGTEEVITRGYLMQVAHRRWGLLAAIAFQAVVFALLHGVNFDVGALPLVNVLLVGLLLGCWALAEGSLWGVCAFHVVWNWCQGNIAGIQVSGMDLQAALLSTEPAPGAANLLTGGGFGVEGSALTTAVLLIATAVAALVLRARAQ
ncbi:CPBP family intramembrane glutamic endopeptidase [Saccharopolyspora griseoalba]|uniref:CPBP family intramembrane glutamic endopeptidase n=1 Tax=Saccharopolyspora griseoalba TaxID=1431848 RepID=A0ABW2LDQ1_9PSEU